MKPSSAKAKGRRLQQYIRDKILATFPSLEPDDVKSTSMGAGGEDIQLSPAARKLMPYTIEAKARAGLTGFYGWYDQAAGHKDKEPLLIIKQDRREPLAVVSLEHFLELIRGRNGG